ncbi:hypothetical protein F5Y18DRAFT_154239 [Xylariaceae sp. FL1019]|nr:hypothetical protein F5Y18DRAFT_154239 [Xylariaceae sp. FL1019]
MDSKTAGSKDRYVEEWRQNQRLLTPATNIETGFFDGQKYLGTELLDPTQFRSYTSSPVSHHGRQSPISLQNYHAPPEEITTPFYQASPHPIGIRGFFATQWQKHRAPILVFIAQAFGALMHLTARLLSLGEVDGAKLHPMQLLFYRMIISLILGTGYIIKRQIPHGVFGDPKVRWMLVGRGISGFLGLYGMWYSSMYLPLAEATVITFLGPNLAGFWCHIFLKDPFTRTEQLASVLALGGVILITKPLSLFSGGAEVADPTSTTDLAEVITNVTTIISRAADSGDAQAVFAPTTTERLIGIGVGLLGVLGIGSGFAFVRALGPRAHPIVSVNYFSIMALVVATGSLLLAPILNIGQPDLHFTLPASFRQCGLVLLVTNCGFVAQILTTQGLAIERSNRAVLMVYSQMLFASAFDWIFWGTTLSALSLIGAGMIIGGAVWVAVGDETKTEKTAREVDVERAAVAGQGEVAESIPMLRDGEFMIEDESEEEGGNNGNRGHEDEDRL